MKPKSKLINFGLFIFGLLIAFLFAEIFLRVIPYQPNFISPPYMYTNHQANGFTLQPGFSTQQSTLDGITLYQINNQGIRSSTEYQTYNNFQNTQGIQRLFVIGDSFTFGWGAEEQETFPYILERLLNKQNSNYKVINLGVPGYNTSQSYNRMLEYAKLLGNPDIVLYMFCPNDPIENIAGRAIVVDGIKITERRIKYKYIAYMINKLYVHSRTIALVVDIYNTTINPKNVLENELGEQDLINREDTSFLLSELEKLQSWTSERNIDLLVMTTHNSEYSSILLSTLKDSGTAILESQNIFDQNNLKSEQVHLKYDGHWNPLGHQVVADALYDFLIINEWIH
ncbi:SGNH/GDSL hydrolase family protein [Chloroflexota bacterium]